MAGVATQATDPGLIGKSILELAFRPADRHWIRRRVDTITFIDEHTVKRVVSLDLDLFALKSNAEAGRHPTFHEHLLLPLALLPKVPHRPIEVLDEGGNVMPRLTKRERLPLMRAGLIGLGELLVPDELTQFGAEATQQISTLVEQYVTTPSNLETRRKAREEMQVLRDGGGAGRHPVVGAVLSKDEFWYAFVDVVDHYYLLVPILVAHATRRIITYQYLDAVDETTVEDTAVEGKHRSSRFRMLYAPPEFRFQLEAPAVADSDTFHLEVEAPYDLRLNDVCMTVESAGRAGVKRKYVDDDRHLARAHVFCAISEPAQSARVTGSLQPVESGMLRSAAIASSLVATVLILGSLGLLTGVIARSKSGVAIEPSTAGALLLLVPGVFASYLSQASRHGLTSKVNFRVRAILGVSSFCSFAAASTVAIELKADWFNVVWIIAAVTATLVALLLLAKFATNLVDIRRLTAPKH